jgi:polar amino acid transport system substrate-binding protein
MTGRSIRNVGAAIVLAVVAGLGLAAAAHSETTLERIKREGAVRIGFANEPPFGFATSSGTVTGESPEIARAVLAKMGLGEVKLEGVVTEFGSLIPGLLASRFDIIAAGMFVRPARCEQISFSEPTVGIGEALMVVAGNPLNLHSYEDVAKNTRATLAVISGGAERDYAIATGIPEDRLKIFLDNPSGMTAVVSGRADAFSLTSLAIQNLIDTAKNPAIERATPFTDPVVNGKSVRGYGAFGFRKEDTDFRAAFNAVLKSYIGSPEHRKLVAQFGFTEAELPGSVTTAELCAGTK